MRDVIRFLFKLILCVLLALAAGFGYLAVRSGDPIYTFYEWISPARFKQYDGLMDLPSQHPRRGQSTKGSISWERGSMSIQLSRATHSTSTAGECSLLPKGVLSPLA